MGKNILFITESYKISPSPNGNCVEKLAKELIGSGDKIIVLTLKNQEIKEKKCFVDGVWVYRVNTYMEWRVLFGKRGTNMATRLLSKIFKELKNIWIPLHPFRSPGVLVGLYRTARQIIQKEKIDIIVAVHRDFETALCGALLGKKTKKLKTILYSLDSISGGVCSNKKVSKEMHVKKCRNWELFFLKSFDRFCAMECHRNILAESIYDEYRHKILFLDIPNLLIKEEENKLNTSDEMNLVFTGMLSETNADCRYFLEVLKEICKTNKVIFHVYGGVSPVIERAFSETGMFGTNIIYHGRVSQNELIEVRNNATAFLNFGNNYECGIPCKIFEYISTGKMIISFAKIDEDASTPYLRRYDNALLLREDLTEIKHQAKVIIEFINLHKNVYISRSEVNREFFSNTPRAFVQMIHSIS